MPQCRYFVIPSHDAWLIRYQDHEYGPYKSQAEAMLFAIDAAQRLGHRGDNAEVCLMGENGRFRAEWRYGQDRHPSHP
jgi:hypothetical protein